MDDSLIKSIDDLNMFRSSPALSKEQSSLLMDELNTYIKGADWFTIGIMAQTSEQALRALAEIQKYYNWPFLSPDETNTNNEPVFLKANQKTGNVLLRIEYNLGEGILISCQHYNEKKESKTIGPLPLAFFKKQDI